MPQTELSDCGWQGEQSVRAQHGIQMCMIANEPEQGPQDAPMESETLPIISQATLQVSTVRLGDVQYMIAKEAHLVVQLGMCPQTNVSQHGWWLLIYIQALSA